MQSKLSVVIVRARSVKETSDMNRMAVHLEQILAEKDGIDLRIRQTLTESSLKSADFIVFSGFDLTSLSELFKALASDTKAIMFMYDEPGVEPTSGVKELLRLGSDHGRLDIRISDRLVSCWTYRDIIGYIDSALRRQLGSSSPSSDPNAIAVSPTGGPEGVVLLPT